MGHNRWRRGDLPFFRGLCLRHLPFVVAAPKRGRSCTRSRREVADIAVDDAEERSDGGLVRRDAVEVAHELG